MVRVARVAVGGVCYHVLNRGNDRKTIFHTASDFEEFLLILAAARMRYPVEIFAFCLMPNHFHFVVRPRDHDTLARWVHWLLTTHAQAHRRSYETAGHLWQGRFKTFPIEHDHHLLTVIRYVERNALRAKLVTRAEAWRWGSLSERLDARRTNKLLDEVPCALPRDWCAEVNAVEAESTLRSVRGCVDSGRPFGSREWIQGAQTELGVQFRSRPRGRPRKSTQSGDAGVAPENQPDLLPKK